MIYGRFALTVLILHSMVRTCPSSKLASKLKKPRFYSGPNALVPHLQQSGTQTWSFTSHSIAAKRVRFSETNLGGESIIGPQHWQTIGTRCNNELNEQAEMCLSSLWPRLHVPRSLQITEVTVA
jgi:hypothetical protein